jgi:hypothetical protein
MLLWLSLSIGLALCALAIAVGVAMHRAERRARYSLYAALGYGDDLISTLMVQKGPVSAQLALIRKTAIAPGLRPDELRTGADSLQTTAQRAFRLTRAVNGARVGSTGAVQPEESRPPNSRLN